MLATNTEMMEHCFPRESTNAVCVTFGNGQILTSIWNSIVAIVRPRYPVEESVSGAAIG